MEAAIIVAHDGVSRRALEVTRYLVRRRAEESRRLDQAWGVRSHEIILTVVASLENVLQEDTELPMWYTRPLVKMDNDLGD